MQDVLKRVGSPVSLEAPRSARGVERRVINRGPSRSRSGCSQRLCRSEGGGDRGSGRGQGLHRSGDDKSREVGVGGAVAAARPVIGNTLRASGSKGEAIKGVTRHLERRRETGFRKKKRFTVTT